MRREVVLSIKNITKSYPGTDALKGISLEFRKGEVHSIIGENGAGKSTLVKVMYGLEEPTAGQIFLNGKEIKLRSSLQALRDHGIAVVPQERLLNTDLTVTENLLLGKIPTHKNKIANRLGMINFQSERELAKQALEKVGATFIDPAELVSRLSVSEQQIVEIARALIWQPDVLLLDEPTATLGKQESESILDLILKLKKQGTSIIFISHRLDEVRRVSDVVSVLRDGQKIGTLPNQELETDVLISMMTGSEVNFQKNSQKNHKNGIDLSIAPLLQLKQLSRENQYKNIELSIYKGEIVGLAGLVGSGRSHILNAIFGLELFNTGLILFEGKPIMSRDPRNAVKKGIGLVPANRKKEGVITMMDVRDNLTISFLDRLSRFGLLHKKEQTMVTQQFISSLRIKLPGINSSILNLSGGNQQKVIMSRWLLRKPKLLLIDEPTQGIDVMSRWEIHQILKDFATNGGTILVVSSDIQELIELSDRIIVLDRGQIVDEITQSEATVESILSMCHGVSKQV